MSEPLLSIKTDLHSIPNTSTHPTTNPPKPPNMRLSILAPLALLVSSVAADGASIVAAIQKIDATTKSLGAKVAGWNGVLIIGTIPIVADSTELLNNLKAAKKAAKASDLLDDLGAIQVAQAVIALSTSVNVTLGQQHAAKPAAGQRQ